MSRKDWIGLAVVAALWWYWYRSGKKAAEHQAWLDGQAAASRASALANSEAASLAHSE
jgi:hypothetical protein